MKLLLFFIAASLLLSDASAQPAFTNHVKMHDGVYFCLTDDIEGVSEAPRRDELLESGRMIYYIVDKVIPDAKPLLVPEMHKRFAFDLFDAASNIVRKSALGLSNSIVPPQLLVGRRERRVSTITALSQKNATYIDSLFRVDDYFLIPKAGRYVLEVHLRFCFVTNGNLTWALSSPVRLPVLVKRKVEVRP